MIINREILKEKLDILVKGWTQKTPMPVLSFLKLDDDTLTISNSMVNIMTSIESTNIKALIPFKQLYDIVNKLTAKEIELIQNDNKILIKSGRSKFNLVCGDYSEYPNYNMLDDINYVEIKTDKFIEIINKINYACSKSEKRPILTGVNFDKSASATDSFRLARYNYDLGLNCTISYNDLNNLVSILKNTESVKVRNNLSVASFEFGDTIYQTRLLDGKYPDVSRLIMDSYAINCEVNKQDLINAIERVNILNNDDYNVISLEIDNDNILVRNTSSQIGDGLEVVECKCNELIKVACNSDYLIDALRSFDKENVVLDFTDASRPFAIRDGELTALILPVRMG